MDNVTHSLVGLAAAKAGLDRLSPYATVTCVLAANAPDCDLLGLLGGRWFNFQHHRGITHSLVGVLALSILLPTMMCLLDRWRAGSSPKARWGPLFVCALALTASHPFLDWTNSYGVRPLLPWDGRWFYGDFAFVVEPFFWLTLGVMGFTLTARNRLRVALWGVWAGLALLALLLAQLLRGVPVPWVWPVAWLGGVALAVYLRKIDAARFGPRLAQVALYLLAAYLGGAAAAQRLAHRQAAEQAQQMAAQRGEKVGQVAATSLPGNPFQWLALAETDKATYRFGVGLTGAARLPAERFAKPEGRAAQIVGQAFTQDERARIWRGFARFPAARVKGDCLSETVVQFADLRFAAPGDGRSGSFAPVIPVACEPEKMKQ